MVHDPVEKYKCIAKKTGGYHDEFEDETSSGAGGGLLYRAKFWLTAVDWKRVGEGVTAAEYRVPQRPRCLGMVDTAAGHSRERYRGRGIRRS